jgi:hypothetical protein
MKLFTNKDTAASSAGLYLLIDNDFLSELFRDGEVLNEFLDTFAKNYFILYPFTEFEFLRDIFEPKQRRLKKTFIAQTFFLPMPHNQEIFKKIYENAMLLSLIYSHKGHNRNTKISLVDLFLGARAMLNAHSMLVITGNKKDFPNSIYDIVTIINIEQNDGSIKPYSVLRFNKRRFDTCYAAIAKLEKKYDLSLEETE